MFLFLGESLKDHHLKMRQSDFASHYRTVLQSTLD